MRESAVLVDVLGLVLRRSVGSEVGARKCRCQDFGFLDWRFGNFLEKENRRV